MPRGAAATCPAASVTTWAGRPRTTPGSPRTRRPAGSPDAYRYSGAGSPRPVPAPPRTSSRRCAASCSPRRRLAAEAVLAARDDDGGAADRDGVDEAVPARRARVKGRGASHLDALRDHDLVTPGDEAVAREVARD